MSYRVGPYLMTKTLGQGTFGKVKLAEHQGTGQQYAIKILDKGDIKSHDLTMNVRREIAIMKALNHRNIVNLREVLSSKHKLYIVMDLVRGGELFEMIEKQGELSEKLARKYFQQLVDGVEYCHRRGVVHRDLKPENLLVDANGTLKITDFGVSSMKGLGQDLLYTACGTPYYAAPEILVSGNNGYNGQKVDAWSCGVILFLLLSGQLPFMEEDMNKLYEDIKAVRIEWPSEIQGEPKQLIARLLTKDPDKRYDLTDVKRNPWFLRDYEDNLREFEALDAGIVPRPASVPTTPAPAPTQLQREAPNGDGAYQAAGSPTPNPIRSEGPMVPPSKAHYGGGGVPGDYRDDEGFSRRRSSISNGQVVGLPMPGSSPMSAGQAHAANGMNGYTNDDTQAYYTARDSLNHDPRVPSMSDRSAMNGYDSPGGSGGVGGGGSSVGLAGGNSGSVGTGGGSGHLGASGLPKDYRYILDYYNNKPIDDFISDALPGKPEKKIQDVTTKLGAIDIDCIQDLHVLVETTGHRQSFVKWFEDHSDIPAVTAMRIAKLFFD